MHAFWDALAVLSAALQPCINPQARPMHLLLVLHHRIITRRSGLSAPFLGRLPSPLSPFPAYIRLVTVVISVPVREQHSSALLLACLLLQCWSLLADWKRILAAAYAAAALPPLPTLYKIVADTRTPAPPAPPPPPHTQVTSSCPTWQLPQAPP